MRVTYGYERIIDIKLFDQIPSDTQKYICLNLQSPNMVLKNKVSCGISSNFKTQFWHVSSIYYGQI